MIELDLRELIFAAWARIRPTLIANPDELRRRLARRDTPELRRPPRAWCIVVRASDTRLERALVDDPHDPEHSGQPRPHELLLDRALLLELCAPVTIEPGGELWDTVARKMGVRPTILNTARINGTLRTDHVPGFLGRFGPPVPFLSSNQPLDPTARGFRQQDRWWGSTSRLLPLGLDEDFRQVLTRVPVFRPTVSRRQYRHEPGSESAEPDPPRPGPRLPKPRPDPVWYKWRGDEYVGYDWRNPLAAAAYHKYQDKLAKAREYGRRQRQRNPPPSKSGGSLQFRGWLWRCPQCGRAVNLLYLPLRARVIDLPQSIKDQLADATRLPKQLELPDSDQVEDWAFNGAADLRAANSAARFACKKCHRVRFFEYNNATIAWNNLITHLSGGLLFGREVPRPREFAPAAKYRKGPCPNARPALRREQITRMILSGMTPTQIAAELRIKRQAVMGHLHKIYKSHNLPRRGGLEALAKKLNPETPSPKQRVRGKIIELLLNGFTQTRIAETLDLSLGQVSGHLKRHILPAHGVHSVKDLIQKLRRPVSGRRRVA